MAIREAARQLPGGGPGRLARAHRVPPGAPRAPAGGLARAHRVPLGAPRAPAGGSRGLTECPRVRRAPLPGGLLVELAEGKPFQRRSSYGPAPSPDGLD